MSQDSKKAKLVDTATRLLNADPEAGSEAARFAKNFYSRPPTEDVICYSANELAVIALDAWKHIAERSENAHKVTVYNPAPIESGGQLGSVTILLISNNNMPFLVDSIMSELQGSAVEIELVVHPIIWVERTKSGALKHYHGADKPSSTAKAKQESVISIHLRRIESVAECQGLVERVEAVLNDVRVVVRDWQPMCKRLEQTVRAYKTSPPPISVDEIAEAVQFLEWVLENNFTFLGMREYAFVENGDGGELQRMETPGLGLLSNPDVRVLRRGKELVTFTPELREFLVRPEPLIITKANVRSRVHRRAHMDYIGVKMFDEEGGLQGELRIVGLFTSTAYTRSAMRIPYLRRKVDMVLSHAQFDPNSHSGRALLNVLEGYPRDELFQLDPEVIYDFAFSVLQLVERPRIRVLARRDKFDRFVSILVFVPRERYSTNVRLRIGEYFANIFKGRLSAWYVTYPEGPLARVHLIIGRDAGKTPVIAQSELEQAVTLIVRTWSDNLREELEKAYDATRARLLFERYVEAFIGGYRENFSASDAVSDLERIEPLTEDSPLAISYQRRADSTKERIDLKLYHNGRPIPLSDRLPIIEHMGFRAINERTYRIARSESATIWLHDILLERGDGMPTDLESLRDKLEDGFMAVWTGQAENDGFNALIVLAGLHWRDVAVLRALARYLRQAGIRYSQDYIWATVCKHPKVAVDLVALFYACLNPDGPINDHEAVEEKFIAEIETALESVSSLDEDRILRRYVNLITSILRTNFFQRDEKGDVPLTISFKLDPKHIDDLPEPRPLREIFVYSPRVEGVHLRGGMIARGGLRWSDRPQDFRTEVLGLAKAQQVKNAVIVPFGAKGGFVPKQLPSATDREAFLQEGIESYKIFISSLLDITDNLDAEGVLPPSNVVRHDGDDPYLVVAADKGTATFSDTANGISEDHGFWLGDAFASGGSAGYDHKKMGITARGGWEAVKRHFREMDRNIQEEPFTVVGVGDMSGDVFGNGMLLSEATKLIAAFDHRDIFIEPNPDLAISFAERKRLFEMDRSSWQDYDLQKISKGGGVYSRSSKIIQLSAEACKAIGMTRQSATPQEIMTAILKTDADLLWFGGIGTYVRASSETDEAAGDRANDAIRVTAKDLGVKVIGEGANLGLTQRARIEFALAGGQTNTDAIDNSAGVNSSDVEVNIKIALGTAERTGKLKRAARNRLLSDMTDSVAALVLRNNYLQTLALSLCEKRNWEDFSFQVRLMRELESLGQLDRLVEFLPDDLELMEREASEQPLTRPELAVLLAYAKIRLFGDLLNSSVPDEDYLGREVYRYFPEKMHKKYAEEIENHRLRREIIATMLSNSMVNRGGITIVQRIADRTGATTAEIAYAFVAVRDSFNLTDLNTEIDVLDNKIKGAQQLDLYSAVQDLLLDKIGWFLHNANRNGGLAEIVTHYQAGIAEFIPILDDVLPDFPKKEMAKTTTTLVKAGLSKSLSTRIARLPILATIPDMILVRDNSKRPAKDVGDVFFKIGSYFGLGRLEALVHNLQVEDYYDRLALDRGRELLANAHRRIVREVLDMTEEGGYDAWLNAHKYDIERTRDSIKDIIDSGQISVSKIAVAASILADLSSH